MVKMSNINAEGSAQAVMRSARWRAGWFRHGHASAMRAPLEKKRRAAGDEPMQFAVKRFHDLEKFLRGKP
jgi:hypothetical protein